MVKILATVAVSGILAGPACHVKPEGYVPRPSLDIRAALTTVIGVLIQQWMVRKSCGATDPFSSGGP